MINLFIRFTNKGKYSGNSSYISHHAGHGHRGNRSGLDVDFRYLNKNGRSFQSSNAFNNSNFSTQNSQTVYDRASIFGFDTNYQGTSGNLKGARSIGGHNDHGHLGRSTNNSKIYNINASQIPSIPAVDVSLPGVKY